MSRVYMLHGASFTGKTACAGSGPGRKWFAEFDPGSFERAGFPNKQDFEVKRYFPPLEHLLDFGSVRTTQQGVLSRNLRMIHGIRELLEEFNDDLIKALQSGDFADIIYDTEGLLWDRIEDGFRQQVQEAGRDWDGMSQRDKYTEPNRHMDSYLHVPGMMNCNLMLVSHEKEVWANNQPTGDWIPDGWKHAIDYADVSLRFRVQDRHPVATVGKAGAAGMKLRYMELDQPTIAGIDLLLDAAEAMRSAGLNIPKTAEEVIKQGKGLL